MLHRATGAAGVPGNADGARLHTPRVEAANLTAPVMAGTPEATQSKHDGQAHGLPAKTRRVVATATRRPRSQHHVGGGAPAGKGPKESAASAGVQRRTNKSCATRGAVPGLRGQAPVATQNGTRSRPGRPTGTRRLRPPSQVQKGTQPVATLAAPISGVGQAKPT